MIHVLFTHTPLAFFVQDLWRDEAFSYTLAKRGFFDIIFLSLQDFSPPFYHFALKIWMTIFGSSEIAMRSLSLLFFVGLLYVVYDFFLYIFKFDHKSSFLGMLLFLINPLLVYYAFEARAYSMFAFLTVLSFYALILKKRRLYLIATIAGLYTHYFMLFTIVIQVVYLMISRHKDYKMQLRQVYISFLTFLPWLVFAVAQKVTSSTQFWIDKVQLKDILYLPAVMYSGYEKSFGFPNLSNSGYPLFLLVLSLILIVTIVIAYLKVKDKPMDNDKSLFILFLIWAGLPSISIFFLSFIKPLYLPRYLILCAPGLIFLFVHSLKFIKNPVKIILVGLVIVLTFYYNNLQIQYRKKADVSRIFNEINAQSQPKDVIYVPNELDYFIAQYYTPDHNVYLYGTNYKDIPNYVGKALIPEDHLRNSLPNYPVRAFIYKGYGYEIQTLY